MAIFAISPARRLMQTWVPIVVLFLLVITEHVPMGRDWLATLEVGLVFVPIFFLARYSEGAIAPIAVLLLGVLKDLTSETPIGFWGFLFTVFFILAIGQRQLLYNAAFTTLWATFGFLCFLIYAVFYVMSVLSLELALNFGSTILGALLTVFMFPLINLVFSKLEHDDHQRGVF